MPVALRSVAGIAYGKTNTRVKKDSSEVEGAVAHARSGGHRRQCCREGRYHNPYQRFNPFVFHSLLI